MGKKGQGRGARAAAANQKKREDPMDILGELFRPLPPNKRSDLNKLVEKLLHLTSNFGSEPTTPQQFAAEFKEIHSLVEKIRDIESSGNLSRKVFGPRKSHFEGLLKWLGDNGANLEGVEVAAIDSKQGYGLRTTKDFKFGDVALTIPRSVMMSVETAKNSEIGRLVETDAMLKTMSNVTLSLHLMMEKTSPASFWEPYINTLPQQYNTVLYFKPEDFDLLKGSPAYEDGLKQYKYVARQYAYFYRRFESTLLKDYFTYDEYRWAVSTVMTRQNQVPSADGEQMVNTLIPLWDMANHDDGLGEISTDYDDEAKALKCMAAKDYKAGDQFTIFYGKRSNHDLLVHNGFTVDENSHNSLAVRLGVGKNDPLSSAKCDLLAKLFVSPHGHFKLFASGVFDNQLLAFLRVMNMKTEEDLKSWEENEEKMKSLLDEKSCGDPDLDKKVKDYLKIRCSLLLKSYPQTLEDDVELLKNSEMFANARNCVVLRKGEKQILIKTIELCN